LPWLALIQSLDEYVAHRKNANARPFERPARCVAILE
jgi:hypothetical protein